MPAALSSKGAGACGYLCMPLDMPLDMVKASFFGTRRAPHRAKGPCEGYCNYGRNYKKTALRRFYNAGQCGVYCGCAAKPNPAGCERVTY